MKRLFVLTLLLTSCSASTVQENQNLRELQNNNIVGGAQNKYVSIGNQEDHEFRIIIPSAIWTSIYFESINKRAEDAQLPILKLKALPNNDLEVRVWSGFGITALRGFVLKRTSGNWQANHLDGIVFRERKSKKELKKEERKLDQPKSGWDNAWQKLIDAGILNLPDPEDSSCRGDSLDGMSYVVEYNFNNTYRTYMYDNPEIASLHCPEYKPMLEINQIIAEEFYQSE